MPSEEPLEDRCGARCRDGGFCTQYPVTGSERCRMHGGKGSGPPKGSQNALGNNGGAPELNTNGMVHGVRAHIWGLYENEDHVREWVDALAEAYREHFGLEEHDPRMVWVVRGCLHIYQANRGEAEILADGMSEQQVVDTREDGTPVIRDEEHHLAGLTLKRDREARQMFSHVQDAVSSNQSGGLAGALGELAADGFEVTLSAEEREVLDIANDVEPDTVVDLSD